VNTQRLLRTGAGLGGVFIASALAGRGEPNDKPLSLLVGGAGVACMASALFVKDPKELTLAGRVKAVLDTVLLHWTESDPFTVRQLLDGGVCVMGRTGSGKSSSSGYQIGKAIVRLPGSGGLILSSKPEDKEFWHRIFEEAGRSQDLLVFEPSSPLRYNLLDGELKAGADTREITQLLMTIGETLKRNSRKKGSENDAFWDQLKERTIYNAVEIVKKATGKVNAADLQRFITGAATSPAQLSSPEWQKGFHNQCLALAHYAHKTPAEQHDHSLALDFFLSEYPAMDPKPRSSSLADVLNVFHVLCSGTVRQLLADKSNVGPEVLEQGKWIQVHMPIPTTGAAGAFVNGAWKYAVQRHILRRHAMHDAKPIIIWSDEYQRLVNTADAEFLAECRSHRVAMVVLTQSIHSFYGAMPGEAGEHQAAALLANFAGAKIFHALGDAESAAYASSLCGKSLQTFVGGSTQPQEDLFDELMGHSKHSGNFSQHFEKVLQDNEFMHKLRTGGETNGCVADAIVIRNGQPFANGENWIRVAFSQG
jgi:hypothetical protein